MKNLSFVKCSITYCTFALFTNLNLLLTVITLRFQSIVKMKNGKTNVHSVNRNIEISKLASFLLLTVTELCTVHCGLWTVDCGLWTKI